MREHRWETSSSFTFAEVNETVKRLAKAGLTTVYPEKDLICYIEEWEVDGPREIAHLDAWPLEDVTLIHVMDGWKGDFFLLTGQYHTLVQQYRSVNTYCSLCHPWRIHEHMVTLKPNAMLWVGFRHTHAFIRVRVHTTEIVAPGETWVDHQRPIWADERRNAFLSAIHTLELPLSPVIDGKQVAVRSTREDAPLFCSWPDAFGPCQIELNSPDVYEFLVPASQLAATYQGSPPSVRAYLTGFTEDQLLNFDSFETPKRSVYRCSAHCQMQELPELLSVLGDTGRLYATLCEFQTASILPSGIDSAVIIGVVASRGQFQIEARLNRCPLSKDETADWLEQLVGIPMHYAPLSAFP
ncbi:MAG: hypothetical protein MRJ96_13230 [Nitrospirales bacterium]|nr:hypothetical protein [Nitrospira sp.]MDR4502407.1 hypothetical protein [Nitrospirales bacterium]